MPLQPAFTSARIRINQRLAVSLRWQAGLDAPPERGERLIKRPAEIGELVAGCSG
jgi:hypothetical protein